MNPRKFEQYLFYRLYDSIDFNQVLHSIRLLKRYRRKDVRYCILRDLVVSYARPFSGNKGKLLGKNCLGESVVPKPYRSLHRELLGLRARQFAHTDLTHYEPKVGKWHGSTRLVYPMSFRGYDYATLDTRVAEIENLVRSVVAGLQSKICEIESEL